MSNHRKLQQQLQTWVDQDIISEEQAEQILVFEGAAPARSSANWGNIIAGSLAALLIGGGIVLIFAYNWESLGKTARIALSFLPLIAAQVLYGFAYFKYRNEVVWKEAATGFLATMLTACIALISQTYNIGGAMSDFILLLLILGIPLLLLMPSASGICLYLGGITYWAYADVDQSPTGYWLLLLPVIFSIWQFGQQEGSKIRSHFIIWSFAVSFAISWFGAHWKASLASYLLGTSFWLAVFYMAIIPNYARHAMRTVALFGIFQMSLLLTFFYDWREDQIFPEFSFEAGIPWNDISQMVVILIAAILWTWLLVVRSKWNTLSWSERGFILFPLLILLAVPLGASPLAYVVFLLMNAYLLGLGILLIQEGIELVNMSRINLGLLALLLLAGVRFFDSNWSLLLKGCAFILLGIMALYIRWRIVKNLEATTT